MARIKIQPEWERLGYTKAAECGRSVGCQRAGYICPKCAGTVRDPYRHSAWHRQQERNTDPVQVFIMMSEIVTALWGEEEKENAGK